MSSEFSRRQFIKTLLYAGGASVLPAISPSAFAQNTYNGKLLISVQLDGGLDVTSFCDPKLNIAGELEINHWARDNDIQQAGNIAYAPFAPDYGEFNGLYQGHNRH